MFSIGICQWCLPHRGPEALALAKEWGYEGVELDLGLGRPAYDLRDPVLRRRYGEAARQAGLALPSLALNGIHMNDPSREAEAHGIIDAALEAAQELSIPTLQMPSFFDCGMGSEEEFAATVRALDYACRAAEGTSIVIASENQLDTAGNLRLLDAVARERFSLYFDTANPVWLDGYDSIAMLEALFPFIRESHVKDLRLDGTNTYRPLGQGDCRFQEAAALFLDRGYAGWIVAENELPPQQLAQDAQTLRALRAATLTEN